MIPAIRQEAYPYPPHEGIEPEVLEEIGSGYGDFLGDTEIGVAEDGTWERQYAEEPGDEEEADQAQSEPVSHGKAQITPIRIDLQLREKRFQKAANAQRTDEQLRETEQGHSNALSDSIRRS